MSDENKQLTPVNIIYVDGTRLDTDFEGSLRTIKINDTLNTISKSYLTFYLDEIKIEDVFSLNSEVSIHLGYKDNVEEVFKGIVTGFEPDYNDYSTPKMTVEISSKLCLLCNKSDLRMFQNLTPSQIISQILDEYGLSVDIEDFGPEYKDFVQNGINDYDFIKQFTDKYGKLIYCNGDKVIIKSEPTSSSENIVLEWGKTLITCNVQESLNNQISELKVFDWNKEKNESFEKTVTMSDIPLKIGGSYTWEDNSKGKTHGRISTVEGAYNEEDAEEIAKAYLLKQSFEYQTAKAETLGDYKIKSGNRLTLKYIGKFFDGEYLIYAAYHTFDVFGYKTEVILKRNCTEASSKSGGATALDKEQADGKVASSDNQDGNNSGDDETSNQEDNTENKDDKPKIVKVELLDDNNNVISQNLIRNYVNLPAEDKYIDFQDIKGKYQLNGRIKCKVTFDREGEFNFNITLVATDLKTEYSETELYRNKKYEYTIDEDYVQNFVTDSNGTKIIYENYFYFGQGGGNKFKFKAWTDDESDYKLSTTEIQTWRRLYYIDLKMRALLDINEIDIKNMFNDYYIDFVKLGTEFLNYIPNIDSYLEFSELKKSVRSVSQKDKYLKYKSYILKIAYVNYLLESTINEYQIIKYLSKSEDSMTYNISSDFGLWININSNDWYIKAEYSDGRRRHKIPKELITPIKNGSYYNEIKINTSSFEKEKILDFYFKFNVITSKVGGYSVTDQNTIIISTKNYPDEQNDFSKLFHIVKHEIGHQLDLVPNSDSSSGLDKGLYYYNEDGPHCKFGCEDESVYRDSKCCMFAVINFKNFCADCASKILKVDISRGLY